MHFDRSPIRSRPLFLGQIVFWFASCIALFLSGWRSGDRGHLGLNLLIAAGAFECVERPMLRYAGIDADAPTFPPARWAVLPWWARLVRIGALCLFIAGISLMFLAD